MQSRSQHARWPPHPRVMCDDEEVEGQPPVPFQQGQMSFQLILPTSLMTAQVHLPAWLRPRDTDPSSESSASFTCTGYTSRGGKGLNSEEKPGARLDDRSTANRHSIGRSDSIPPHRFPPPRLRPMPLVQSCPTSSLSLLQVKFSNPRR